MKWTLVLFYLLTGCGDSPLLHHKVEGSFSANRVLMGQSVSYAFAKTNFSFLIDWEQGPGLGESRFILRTWNNSTGTINGPYQDLPEALNVLIWMPAMGHGSAPVKLTKKNTGEYEITAIYFIMKGTWEVKFQLLKNNQVLDETIVPFNIDH